MSCEFCKICKMPQALQQIRISNGFTVEEYPPAELKKDICDNQDEAARDTTCPAFIDISANGRASTWAK